MPALIDYNELFDKIKDIVAQTIDERLKEQKNIAIEVAKTMKEQIQDMWDKATE